MMTDLNFFFQLFHSHNRINWMICSVHTYAANLIIKFHQILHETASHLLTLWFNIQIYRDAFTQLMSRHMTNNNKMNNFTCNQLNADTDSHLDKNIFLFGIVHINFGIWIFFLRSWVNIFNGQLLIIGIAFIFELASKRNIKNKMWIIGPSECNSSKWQEKKNVQITMMRMRKNVKVYDCKKKMSTTKTEFRCIERELYIFCWSFFIDRSFLVININTHLPKNKSVCKHIWLKTSRKQPNSKLKALPLCKVHCMEYTQSIKTWREKKRRNNKEIEKDTERMVTACIHCCMRVYSTCTV